MPLLHVISGSELVFAFINTDVKESGGAQRLKDMQNNQTGLNNSNGTSVD